MSDVRELCDAEKCRELRGVREDVRAVASSYVAGRKSAHEQQWPGGCGIRFQNGLKRQSRRWTSSHHPPLCRWGVGIVHGGLCNPVSSFLGVLYGYCSGPPGSVGQGDGKRRNPVFRRIIVHVHGRQYSLNLTAVRIRIACRARKVAVLNFDRLALLNTASVECRTGFMI